MVVHITYFHDGKDTPASDIVKGVRQVLLKGNIYSVFFTHGLTSFKNDYYAPHVTHLNVTID